MKNILFILLPTVSHYNSCFGMAYYLQGKGYTVTFSGTPNLKACIISKGFNFYPLQYFAEYTIGSFKLAVGVFLKNAIDPSFVKYRYKEFLFSIQSLNDLYNSIYPDAIFIDAHLSHYYLFLAKKEAHIALIETKLSTRMHNRIPPLSCGMVFKNNLFYWILAKFIWFAYFKRRNISKAIDRLVFLMKNDDYFYQRYAKKNGLILSDIVNQKNAFYPGLNAVSTYILTPSQFEYPWKEFTSNEVHINFPFAIDYSDNNDEFYKALVPILKLKENLKHKIKIVYCSLGTLSSSNYKCSISFLNKLISVFSKLEYIFLIISAGEFETAVTKATFSNIKIFKHLPQLKLLRSCDLMITHGGLNSVKECISLGVPMLVYPLNNRFDQPGNAARVVYHKIGLMGNMDKDREADIKRKVISILDNSLFKENIKNMQQFFQIPSTLNI